MRRHQHRSEVPRARPELTDEERIVSEYKRLKRRGFNPERDSYFTNTSNLIWLPLARRWKRPIQEIKRIVGRESPG